MLQQKHCTCIANVFPTVIKQRAFRHGCNTAAREVIFTLASCKFSFLRCRLTGKRQRYGKRVPICVLWLLLVHSQPEGAALSESFTKSVPFHRERNCWGPVTHLPHSCTCTQNISDKKKLLLPIYRQQVNRQAFPYFAMNRQQIFNRTLLTVSPGNFASEVNPSKSKRRPFYLKTQFVPCSKHFSSRL